MISMSHRHGARFAAALLSICCGAVLAEGALPAGGSKSEAQAAQAAAAPVAVHDAWARPTVPGQSGGGAYMTLKASSALRLVGVDTPVAAQAAVHEMKMDGSIMRMRELPGGLALPAGQAVALKPGSYHIMLTGLKHPLAKGSQFPLTLHFVDASGAKSTAQVQVPVRMTPAGGGMAGMQH